MKWTFQRKWVLGGFYLTVLSMGLVSFVSYKNTAELRQSVKTIQVTYEIINNLTDLYAEMSVAESGRRGYIYFGSEEELRRYQVAVKNLQSEIITIQQQIADNKIQQKQFSYLKFLVAQRLTLLRQSIELYQQDKTAVEKQFFLTQKSINLRSNIFFIFARMKEVERQELELWLNESRTNIQTRIFLENFGIVFSFIIVLIVYFILYYQWKQNQKLEILKQKVAQEKELNFLKIRLFSMISHEFRTPLSVILASSQLMTETLHGLVDNQKLKSLDRIQSSVKLMNNLLTDILMLTRAEAGNLECKPEPINIEEFCLNLVEDTQVLSQAHHSIKFMSGFSGGRVYLDEKLLYSVLNNLLLNAIKYSPNGGQISLILKTELDFIIFQVKDEGIGIFPEDKTKIYEPFYRGQNVDRIVGNGLGLAVIKKCLELQGGEISLESEVGAGTTFTVRIPFKK
ncbi:HAMP domain-containing histidine kinase [Candidatus Gracilibacteria bacterium]|nr:HAMP domain-containing histidine kinase [Candidatus Gracilibacteria bacterium]NJP17754.1 HAMP domain-containing histidine kinase [Hydrococcus sp. CRU_1_1]